VSQVLREKDIWVFSSKGQQCPSPLTAIPQEILTPQPKPRYRSYRHNTDKCVVRLAMYLSWWSILKKS